MSARVACPCVAVGLWKKKTFKKNHTEKDYCKLQCFQEKNYKTKFSTNLILKK